jgi:hypothetical protein
MQTSETTELNPTLNFFKAQENQERIKKEALEELKEYKTQAALTFAVDISPINKNDFLAPINDIYTKLRIQFDMPLMTTGSQAFNFTEHNTSYINWSLELISFNKRLQQAITRVEQLEELTSLDYTGLYWQFLYPLYKSCERMIENSAWSTNPVAENVHWLSKNENLNADEKTFRHSRHSILTSLAYTLIGYYLETPAELKQDAHALVLKSYAKLAFSLQWDLITLLRSPEIALWANTQYPNENSAKLLADLLVVLSDYRNKDGNNVKQNEVYQSWLTRVNQLVEPIARPDETVLQRKKRSDDIYIVMRDIRQIDPKQIHQSKIMEYRIRPALQDQLFEKNAEGKWSFKPRTNINGRHAVYNVSLTQDKSERPHSWIKYLPEQSGMEFSIRCFAERLGLGGVIPGIVGNIRLNGVDTGQAVWISPDISWQTNEVKHSDIQTLAHVIKHDIAKLKKINKASFTRAMLRVLTTNPEDDDGHDYWLVPTENQDYEIVRIDNERAFFAIEKVESSGRLIAQTVLQVKSALYCLSQMQENLDAQVLEDFAKLDMYQVLNAWLKDLQLENDRYKDLFTDTEIRDHVLKGDDISILAVMLPNKLMRELLGRLQLIQHIIRDVLNKGEPITGLTLLRHVEPLLVNKGQENFYYAKAFTKFPESEHVQLRYDYLIKPSTPSSSKNENIAQKSVKSPALAAQQSLRMEKPLTAEDVLRSLEGKDYSPQSALKELDDLANTNASEIWHDLINGNTLLQSRAKAAFSELPNKQRATLIIQTSQVLLKDPSAYTLEQQKIMLEAIAAAPWQRLKLTAFSQALTPKLFDKILTKSRDSLVHLDVSNCKQIRGAQIQWVVQSCYLLESLDISDLAITKLVIQQPTVGNWIFPKLRLLKANRCQSMKYIFLDLPGLQVLEAQECLELEDLKVNAAGAARAQLAGCKKLTFSPLKSILMLTTLYLEFCNRTKI